MRRGERKVDVMFNLGSGKLSGKMGNGNKVEVDTVGDVWQESFRRAWLMANPLANVMRKGTRAEWLD